MSDLPSPLASFAMLRPAPIPVLALEDDGEPLTRGEVIVFPAARGPSVALQFAGPYEPFLEVDGRRIFEDADPESRRALLWLGPRLPALYHALEEERGLLATLTTAGVIVHDVVELPRVDRYSEEETIPPPVYSDHARIRSTLSEAEVALPAYAILGPVAGRSELSMRLRSMFASGTLVEVRREDGGRVLGRRQVRHGV